MDFLGGNKETFKFSESSSVQYDLSDMAKDAVSLMDSLNIEKAHIVGVSMGGMITQIIAIDYPERVKSITPIMTTPGIQNESLSGPSQELLNAMQKSFVMNLKGRFEDGKIVGPVEWKFAKDSVWNNVDY